MNFRKLLTYLAVGTAAVIPFAGAQNPTILQGNYISNVFGQSNFILNPNAQTNIANVTVSSATVTRSTTTPLVATSEFNITTSTATGYADWATRTFDAGMKNQNCEARFTYRGFSVGSTTVQIRQGSNTVAQLTITASTDPRIASINFPCGDLSAATTLRVQQATASLTGTNEIGGIYLGLATNQANVAQAEVLFRAQDTNGASIPQGSATTVVFPSVVFDALGAYNASTGSYTVKKAGRYLIHARVAFAYGSYGANSDNYLLLNKNGTSFSTGFWSTVVFTGYPNPQITGVVDLVVGDVITVSVNQNTGATRALLGSNALWSEFSISRFPTSSELVVTPERQGDWYISAYHNGANPGLSGSTVSTLSEITNGSLTLTPKTGSQPVGTLCASGNNPATPSTSATTCSAGNESLGITFNIPTVGSYKVCAQFSSNISTLSGSTVDLAFALEETSLTSSTALTTNPSNARYIDIISNTAFPFTQCNTFKFDSVGQKAVRLMYQQSVVGTPGSNLILADNSRNRSVNWTVEPLTNQSNSALYVQGPILGAQTGAAISAGYVGEVKHATASGCGTAGLYSDGASVTLSPGVWRLVSTVNYATTALITLNDLLTWPGPQTGDIQTWRDAGYNDGYINAYSGAIFATQSVPVLVRYDGTNLYRFKDGSWTGAYATGTPTIYAKFYRSGGTCSRLYTSILAERIN